MFPKLLTKRKKEVKVDSLTAQVSTFLHRVHINVSDYTRENMLITDIVRFAAIYKLMYYLGCKVSEEGR